MTKSSITTVGPTRRIGIAIETSANFLHKNKKNIGRGGTTTATTITMTAIESSVFSGLSAA
jgi:hypothetical protein